MNKKIVALLISLSSICFTYGMKKDEGTSERENILRKEINTVTQAYDRTKKELDDLYTELEDLKRQFMLLPTVPRLQMMQLPTPEQLMLLGREQGISGQKREKQNPYSEKSDIRKQVEREQLEEIKKEIEDKKEKIQVLSNNISIVRKTSSYTGEDLEKQLTPFYDHQKKLQNKLAELEQQLKGMESSSSTSSQRTSTSESIFKKPKK